jgi:hypothetical protein
MTNVKAASSGVSSRGNPTAVAQNILREGEYEPGDWGAPPIGHINLSPDTLYLFITGRTEWSISYQKAVGTAWVSTQPNGSDTYIVDSIELKVHWINPMRTETADIQRKANASDVMTQAEYQGPAGNFTAEFYATATDKDHGTWTNTLKVSG